MNASRSLPRALAWALTAVFLLLALSGAAYAQYTHEGSCDVPGLCDNGSAWNFDEIETEVPAYPGCKIYLAYEWRTCNGNAMQVRIVHIYWDIPFDPPDPNHPCNAVHDAYLGANNWGGTGSRENFLRKLFQTSLLQIQTRLFNHDYTLDSLSAIAFPNDPDIQERLQQSQCPNGEKIYRAVMAQCMVTATRTIHYPRELKAHRDEKRDGTATIAADDGMIVSRTFVRYLPCGNAGPCCLQVTTICRDPQTNQNQINRTWQTVGGEEYTCPEPNPNNISLLPGETLGECSFYCDQGEIWEKTEWRGGEVDPQLSTK